MGLTPYEAGSTEVRPRGPEKSRHHESMARSCQARAQNGEIMWRVTHTTRLSLCGDFAREAREQTPSVFSCRDGRLRPSRRAKRGVRYPTPPQYEMASQ